MFRITAITRVGLVAVVCVAVAAPQALAKPPVKGKAKVVKVQSVKKTASSSNDNVTLRTGLSTAYAQGCQNGTLPDRTMGGDNNNYEYVRRRLHRLGAHEPLPDGGRNGGGRDLWQRRLHLRRQHELRGTTEAPAVHRRP